MTTTPEAQPAQPVPDPDPEPEPDAELEPDWSREWDCADSAAYQARVEAGLEPEAGQ
jgi:hypothetical protein